VGCNIFGVLFSLDMALESSSVLGDCGASLCSITLRIVREVVDTASILRLAGLCR
jgi:hypothetical protein